MLQYKLVEGNLQHRFQQSRAKIQIFGGGFANGKTTSGVIKALQLAKEYPGSNGLIARSTYPKLNDTIRKEFLKWCPDSWIARKALSVDNVVELSNGSVINFRYIAQQGKAAESSTSNLLSATFDWIVVDQMEDPEISEKDFLDLLGRLRGNTKYMGDDDTMPSSGPRWFIILCNPTRNWVYRKLVKPLHDYYKGIPNPELLINPDGTPMAELFEGSTYENKDNLPEDYIEGLESAYAGQMRSRYLDGKWEAFEGLVYNQYDSGVHLVHPELLWDYLETLFLDGYRPTIFEAYDHGIAKPACYGLFFADHIGNVFCLDGFYEAERSVKELAEGKHFGENQFDGIHDKRLQLYERKLLQSDYKWEDVYADPAIFKRVSGTSRTVGVSTAGLFAEHDIGMRRANNDIVGGIAKVQSYIAIDPTHTNPITSTVGSPRLFINSDLSFIDTEFVDYYWKKDTRGEYEDVPMDRNDHAMDMIKYALSTRPKLATYVPVIKQLPPSILRWGERKGNEMQDMKRHRHG